MSYNRVRAARSYPEQFWQVLEQVAVHKQKLQVELPTVKEAQKVRGSFYAFVGSLRKAKDEYDQLLLRRAKEAKELGEPITPVDPELKRAAEAHEVAGKVMVELPQESLVLNFVHREASWIGGVLDKALQSSGTPMALVQSTIPALTAASAHLDKPIDPIHGPISPDEQAMLDRLNKKLGGPGL